MNIGKKLKEIRESHGLTQKQLAEKIGVTAVTITRYERNQREPKYDMIIKICEIFDISINELIGENITSMSSAEINHIYENDLGKYIFKPSELKESIKCYPSEEQEALFESFSSFINSEACKAEFGYTKNDIPIEMVVDLFHFTLEMLHLKISEIQYKNLIKHKQITK